MKIKHIYWFAYFNQAEPSVRYRAQYPLAYLHTHYHISYDLVHPGYDFRSIITFVRVYLGALLCRKPHSLIVFQKLHSRGLYVTALKILLFCRPRRTLYDIDDAEYTRRPVGTMHHFMRRCSACAAGSQALVDYIRPLNHRVFRLTSPVIDHGQQKTRTGPVLTVGWIGYYGAHRQNLKQLFFPALRDIDFPLKLKLLGLAHTAEVREVEAYFQACPHIQVEAPLHLDWLDEASIYRHICTFDLGVSPLLDNAFNRGKSAFKLKQCLSCGVPVLGSRTGENARFLEDGVNGFFCDSPQDYARRLRTLYQHWERLYPSLSRQAHLSAPAFSLDHYTHTLLQQVGDLR